MSQAPSGAALLIGVSQYLHADRIAPLNYAACDARSLARHLRAPDIGGLPPDHVQVLTDRKATRESVVRHLTKWLPQQALQAEVALIAFAGHGLVHRAGAREEGYLLPYDGDPDDLVTTGIAMSHLSEWIEGIQAKAVVVCLDCCHAGKVVFRGGVATRGMAERQIRPDLLSPLSAGRSDNRWLIASCNAGEQSLEVDELRHGLFTYHLLRGLRGAGDQNGDGAVGVSELFNYISAAVAADAAKYGHSQRPWARAVMGADVVIARPGLEPVEDAPADGPPLAEPGEDVAGLITQLRQARQRRDPALLPTIFRCLGHPAREVHERARRALVAVGWDKVGQGIEQLGRRRDVTGLGHILDGLDALAGDAAVVQALDRLVVLVEGEQRTRALLLLERKRLSLGLEQVRALFREKQQPYEIVKVLGAGLLTAAYLAQNHLTGREVVIRVLRPEFARQGELRAQFLDLSKRATGFVHQGLVLTREVQVFADQEMYFTVRDYVAGVTLRELLGDGRRFGPEQTVTLLRRVAKALTPIHEEQRWHGGVKPSNIFLGKNDRVTLGDPSLAMPMVGSDPARLVYDYRYCPPEVFRGVPLTPAADFYSLGCVAYELMCGTPPFTADSPFELATAHQRDAIVAPSSRGSVYGSRGDDLVLWLLARSPGDRPTSLAAVVEALAGLKAEGVKAPKEGSEQAPVNTQLLAKFDRQHSAIVRPSEADAGRGPLTLTGPEPARVVLPSQTPPEIPGYDALHLIGTGGMGIVYRARHVALDRAVAIKVLSPFIGLDANVRERFRREARTAAGLSHRNLLTVYDVGEHAGVVYIAMEYLVGGSLEQKLRAEAIDPRHAAAMIEDLARGLHHAHVQGVIHRDLKPDNVLLDREGIPKIVDFGIAAVASAATKLTGTGTIIGTPLYMAPEQFTGRGADARSDLYALGTILYRALTGALPFDGGSVMEVMWAKMNTSPPLPGSLRPEIPDALERICLRCLAREPEERYQTSLELAEALRAFLDGEEGPGGPEPAGRVPVER